MKNSYTPIDEEPKLDDCHEAICTNSQTPNSFNGKTSIDSSDKQKVESSTISTRSASVRVTKEDDDSSAKDLTLLQSTLFTLQNQQLYQMQLIEKLQSQLVQTQSRKSKNRTKTSTKIAIQDTDENNQPEKSSTRHCTDDVGQEAPDRYVVFLLRIFILEKCKQFPFDYLTEAQLILRTMKTAHIVRNLISNRMKCLLII